MASGTATSRSCSRRRSERAGRSTPTRWARTSPTARPTSRKHSTKSSPAVARFSEPGYIYLIEPFLRPVGRASGSLVLPRGPTFTVGVDGMAELVERLSDLQHRVSQLRDFL